MSKYIVLKTPEAKPEDALANISKAAILIGKARTLDETFKLKAILKVAEIEAQRKGIVNLEKQVVELKFMLEDKTGEIIEELREKGELAKQGQRRGTTKVPLKTLKDLNLTKNEASEAQKFHNQPEEKKAEIIEAAKEKVGKPREKIIDEVPAEHVHNFVFCSCGLASS